MLRILPATDRTSWESFLQAQLWSPFLQSWTMGEVHREIHQEPVRLEVRDGDTLQGICQGIVVPARRGKHLAIPYGPVLADNVSEDVLPLLIEALRSLARKKGCAFIRMSPFWPAEDQRISLLSPLGFRSAPLHLLAEHVWYIDLTKKNEEDVLSGMRKNTRNLIRRAEREGVTISVSDYPVRDLDFFFALYDETRKRHHFTPYSDAFIRAQTEFFAERNECTLYLAHFNGEVVASSLHMTYGGETSYHHGASTVKYPKCFASYLLQWRAIQDALQRGDKVYNFWGISPEGAKKHPFAGVRTFKTGFGGALLPLVHCMDLPISPLYNVTKSIETIRRWKRGF